MSSISPKSITREQLFDILKKSPLFYLKNISYYMVLWIPVFISLYLAMDIKLLVTLVPLITFISVIASFEMTCTLHVNYNGSFFEKIKVSVKASLNTTLKFIKVDFFWIVLLFVIFVIPLMIAYTKNSDNYDLLLFVAYFSSFAITSAYNIFNVLILGIISMYCQDGNREMVKALHIKAFRANIKIVLLLVIVSVVMLMTMGFFLWLFIIFTPLINIIGFFLFIEIFEPPQLKQEQKQEEDLKNIIPEAN